MYANILSVADEEVLVATALNSSPQLRKICVNGTDMDNLSGLDVGAAEIFADLSVPFACIGRWCTTTPPALAVLCP